MPIFCLLLIPAISLGSALTRKYRSVITKRLSAFENAYLARSLSRVFDPINLLFQKFATLKNYARGAHCCLS